MSRVAYFPHQKSGCYWYRIKQPMDMLASKGIETCMVQLDKDMDDFQACQFYGARPYSCEKVFEYLKNEGKKIVYDMDDAMDLIDPSNPFYYAVKKDLSSVNESIKYADEITVSTPAMAEYVRTKTSKNITVIPNCYTPSEWTFPRPQREGIRIGFAGSATHVKDLIDIIPIIQRLQAKYPVTFVIMGFGLKSYEEWYKDFRYVCTPDALKDLETLDLRLAKIKFEWVPFIDFDKYPISLINMALDIGLCPLKETPFDRCRSACKAMEYTLSGALAIASDTEPYRNDKNSLLVKDDEWEMVLETMINNPEERKRIHASHLKWTQEHRNIESQLEPLKQVYGV